jgi:UDPglucose 6-dehydrogenase
VDIKPEIVEKLNSGHIHIYEPGLEELVQQNRAAGRLSFTTDLAAAVKGARLIFVAVPTPELPSGHVGMQFVNKVVDDIAALFRHAQPGRPGDRVLVLKSTVPPGTNRMVTDRLAAAGCGHVSVASNPEFLKEGAAIDDFMNPDRVVVGVRHPAVGAVLRELYGPYCTADRPFVEMSPESAEMTKYAANAMLATKISFINEIAQLCDATGADVNLVRKGIGYDQRIGFQFLAPGPGYGGSCFAADETVFVVEANSVRAVSLGALFHTLAKRVGACAAVGAGAGGPEEDAEAVVPPADDPLRVLAWDLDEGRAVVSDVHVLTRRAFDGAMMEIRTGMGRRLRVTDDHPVVVWTEDGTEIVPAAEVQPGQQIAALHALPEVSAPTELNLIELLAGTELEQDVLVAPTDDSFTAQYPRFARHVPVEALRHPVEIRDNNRMRLSLFRALQARGLIDVPASKLQLYTAKGAGTRLNALIPLDADFARLCGYYLAEGFISADRGRAGAVRQRIGFCFHVAETGYTSDLHRILRGLGLKFLEKTDGNAHSTIVSSRVFAWLLRDVLGCGVRSEDKVLPGFALPASADVRAELVRGAFSGDGAVTLIQDDRNMMYEYATVSKRLADGMALLLQSLGVVVSIRRRMMNKSKVPAYILRVSGYEQLSLLRDAFGDKHRARIDAVLAGYERHIRPHGYQRAGDVSLLTVRSVEADREAQVYSLETSHGTVIASSGLVCHNCFPKDVKGLIAVARRLGLTLRVAEAVDAANDVQKEVLFAKISHYFDGKLAGKTFAVWGLAFKPKTDDIREAPALTLIDSLLAAGAKVKACDPQARANVEKIYRSSICYADDPMDTLHSADAMVLVTEWAEFRGPDFEEVKRRLKSPVIFDGRNLFAADEHLIRELGFHYYGIGRGD